MRDRYRNKLIDTVRTLENTLEELHTNIINMAMAGEFSDFDTRCEVGEVLKFSIEDFRKADDQNIKICIELFDKIYDLYSSIMNINAIKREEIDIEDDEADFGDDLPF